MKCDCELFLKIPDLTDKEAVLNFKNELLKFGGEINGEGGIVRENLTYDKWLEKLRLYSNPKTVPEGKVRGDHFLTYRKTDKRLVGMVNIRYELNDFLSKFGGHIGDCVRPTERNKGYATEQIRLALDIMKANNIYKVLMTCKKSNIASAKSIEKNNAKFENEIVDDNGIVFNRYWIDIK